MAWYGGFTFVQAKIRSGDNVIPIIQRVEDEKFQSVFITTDPKIKTLADLKGVTFSFGSQSSTSGHLMPRTFLAKAGINPEEDFNHIQNYERNLNPILNLTRLNWLSLNCDKDYKNEILSFISNKIKSK